MRQVAGDVSGDLVPHRNGLDVGKGCDHFLVVVEILVERLRIFVDEFDGYSLDVGGSYSSHIFHRVIRLMDIPYLKHCEERRLQHMPKFPISATMCARKPVGSMID